MPSPAVKLKPFPSTKLHRGPTFMQQTQRRWIFFSRNVKTFVKPASPLNHKDLKLFTFVVEKHEIYEKYFTCIYSFEKIDICTRNMKTF